MLRLCVAAVVVSLTYGMKLRLGADDPVIQPIHVDEITAEDENPVVETTKSTPSPYMANPPSEYVIEPVLEPALGANELTVNVTRDDMDLCNRLIGPARIDAGCQGATR